MRKTLTSAPRQVRPRLDVGALIAAADPEPIEVGSIRFAEIDELIDAAQLVARAEKRRLPASWILPA